MEVPEESTTEIITENAEEIVESAEEIVKSTEEVSESTEEVTESTEEIVERPEEAPEEIIESMEEIVECAEENAEEVVKEPTTVAENDEDSKKTVEDIIEMFKKLGECAENAKKKMEQELPQIMSKDEFAKKMNDCPNFRAQMFIEPRFFNMARHRLNMDELYEEYKEMKDCKTAILSQFVKGNILYICEKIGNRVRVMYKEYDYEAEGIHNIPTSECNEIMPTDDEMLQYWKVESYGNCFVFEQMEEKIGGFLTSVRLQSIKKDVFLFCEKVIVHVQDFDPHYESKEEEILIPKFMEYANSIGSDKIEEILDRILKEEPELRKKPE